MTDARVLPIGTGGHGLAESRIFRMTTNLNSDMGEASASVLNPLLGSFVPRNSPTIINAALLRSMFWDARVERPPENSTVSTPEDPIDALLL